MMQDDSAPTPSPDADRLFPGADTDLGTLEVSVSEAANDRYWAGAGIDHPMRQQQVLYAPMAVNLTILLWQRSVRGGILHTREELLTHAIAPAPAHLSVRARVETAYVKRGREYVVVASEVHTGDGTLLWSSQAELASSRTNPDLADTPDAPRHPRDPVVEGETRRLTLTAEMLRTYSRAGNFHSDDAEARAMGLPGMTAMGMQTIGPACGLALERWGPDLLAAGRLTASFFGLVLEDDTVESSTVFDDDVARFSIENLSRGAATATGTISLSGR